MSARKRRSGGWCGVGAVVVVAWGVAIGEAAEWDKGRTWPLSSSDMGAPVVSDDAELLVYQAWETNGVELTAWDTGTGRALWTQTVPHVSNTPSDPITTMTHPSADFVLSPDKTLLAYPVRSSRVGAQVQLRETRRGTVVRTLRAGAVADQTGSPGMAPFMFGQIVFAPNNKWLAAVDYTSSDVIHLWDPKTGKSPGILRETGTTFVSIRFSPDGQRLAAIGCPKSVVRNGMSTLIRKNPAYDEVLFLWEMKGGRKMAEIKLKGTKSVSTGDLTFSTDGRLLAHQATDASDKADRPKLNQVCLRDMENGGQKQLLAMWANETLRFAIDGKTLWGLRRDSDRLVVEKADLASGRIAKTIDLHLPDANPFHSEAVLSPDGDFLAVATKNDGVRLYSTEYGKELASLQGPRKDMARFRTASIAILIGRPPNRPPPSLFVRPDGTRVVTIALLGQTNPKTLQFTGHPAAISWNLTEKGEDKKDPIRPKERSAKSGS
ncbi:MAG: WD40 repeat domain-containing protein [Pirellulales bacterium]|nr:WD40 repeat domain-containing protein [Pirellulales bacterium]